MKTVYFDQWWCTDHPDSSQQICVTIPERASVDVGGVTRDIAVSGCVSEMQYLCLRRRHNPSRYYTDECWTFSQSSAQASRSVLEEMLAGRDPVDRQVLVNPEFGTFYALSLQVYRQRLPRDLSSEPGLRNAADLGIQAWVTIRSVRTGAEETREVPCSVQVIRCIRLPDWEQGQQDEPTDTAAADPDPFADDAFPAD